jgi:hypothetical protein
MVVLMGETEQMKKCDRVQNVRCCGTAACQYVRRLVIVGNVAQSEEGTGCRWMESESYRRYVRALAYRQGPNRQNGLVLELRTKQHTAKQGLMFSAGTDLNGRSRVGSLAAEINGTASGGLTGQKVFL